MKLNFPPLGWLLSALLTFNGLLIQVVDAAGGGDAPPPIISDPILILGPGAEVELNDPSTSFNSGLKKLDYQPNLQYQNTVGSLYGANPRPVTPFPPPYFVYGGIFSITTDSTPSGLRSVGYQETMAMICAVNEVNKKAEENNMTTKFFYNIVDDHNQIAVGMQAAQELLDIGVTAVIGPSVTDLAEVVGSLLTGFGVPLISASATADFLSDPFIYSSFLRTVPPDRYTAEAMAMLCQVYNWSLVTSIYTLTTYGAGLQRQFEIQTNKRNITIICNAIINPGGQLLISGSADCLQRSQSNVVFLFMNSTDARNCITGLYQYPELRDLVFVLPTYFYSKQQVEALAGPDVPLSFLTGTIGIDPTPFNFSDYYECISSFKPYTTDIPHFDDFYQVTSNCLLSNDSSLPLCPEDINSRAPYPNYNCTCRPDDLTRLQTPSTFINYIYDAVYAVYNALFQLQFNCTGLQLATGLPVCNLRNFTSAQLVAIIRLSQFYGKTGRVAFFANDRTDVNYTITQIGENGDTNAIGFYAPGYFAINQELTTWKDGSPPSSSKEPQEIAINSSQAGLAWVAIIFCALGILATLFLMGFFFRHRETIVVKKTSFVFSELILTGILLCFVSQILWSVKQTSALCILKVWLFAIGFGLIMANLIAKTYRINAIFRSSARSERGKRITDNDLYPFVIIVLLLEIAMLSVYSFAGGTIEPQSFQSESDFLLVYVRCQSPSSFLQTFGTITLLVMNFIMILVCCYFAYRTRHVASDYNESQYIGSIIFVYFLTCLIILPLYYTSGDSRSSIARQFIFRSIGVIGCLYATMSWLFGTKIRSILDAAKDSKMEKRELEEESKKRIQEVPEDTHSHSLLPISSAVNAHPKRTSGRRNAQQWDMDLEPRFGDDDYNNYFPGRQPLHKDRQSLF